MLTRTFPTLSLTRPGLTMLRQPHALMTEAILFRLGFSRVVIFAHDGPLKGLELFRGYKAHALCDAVVWMRLFGTLANQNEFQSCATNPRGSRT